MTINGQTPTEPQNHRSLSDALFSSIRRSEEALQRSEECFRSLTENISDASAVINAYGMLRYISPSSEKVFGYRQEEVAGRSAFDFVHPDDQLPCYGCLQLGNQKDKISKAMLPETCLFQEVAHEGR